MRRAVLMAVALLPAGCATIFHGRTQKIEIVTDPAGAVAVAEGQRISTPGFLRLRRDLDDVEIRIEKDGYAPRTVRLTRRLSSLVWTNLGWAALGLAVGTTERPLFSATSDSPGNAWAVGGGGTAAFGMGVDFVTGAAYRLEPVTIVVKLTPATPAR